MWSFKRDIFMVDDGTTIGATAYQYLVNASATNGFSTQTLGCNSSTIYPIWTSASTINDITTGTILYGDVGLTNPWTGEFEWYGIGTSYGGSPLSGYTINNSGVVGSIGTCNYIITNGSVSASAFPPTAYTETYNNSITTIQVNVTTTFRTKLTIYNGPAIAYGYATINGNVQNITTSGADAYGSPITLTPGTYNCGYIGARVEGSTSIYRSAGYSIEVV